MEKYNKIFGTQGENAAEKYLAKKGYEILCRNFRIRGGEIDIIARKGEFTVFVEVKTRHSDSFGTPGEAVTQNKIKRIINAANYYIMQNGNLSCRFDVMEVYGSMKGDKFKLKKINHIENAFM
ncbi:MAG: YraN family protein [Eubacteriales bacterium]|jgi:putative endonuclease|nr:YraN family protein [Eubacteriales bacterium]